MVGFADSNRTALRVIPEVTWGATPASGSVRALRFTAHSLSQTKNTVTSQEIRDDRMVPSIIETEGMSNGGINFEFSSGSYDDFLEGFLMGTWTRPMTFDYWKGIGVSWTANNKVVIAGADYTAYLTVSRRIKTEGFVNPVNNGFFSISSLAYTGGNTEITVGTTTSIVEAGNVSSKVMDANDVIILNNTAIRSGTASAATFDSNGGNAFASAISAGQLVIGQKIYVEGLGYESGSYALSAVLTTQTFTLNDGVTAFTLTAGTDFAVGASAANSATALAAKINDARVNGFLVSGSLVYPRFNATVSSGTVTVVNLRKTGGTISKANDSGPVVTVTALSGGANIAQMYTLTAVANDTLSVTPAPPTNANAGGLKVNIRGSMLRNPGNSANIVEKSFSIESHFTDVNVAMVYDGLEVSEFSLDVSAGAIMTGNINLMGRATTSYPAGAKLGASPYVQLETTATEPMNATTNVGTIKKNGVATSVAIQSIKLDGKGGLANRMAVANKFPVGIRSGRFTISGSMMVYFANLEMWNHFNNHETISLNFPFNDLDSNRYEVTIPALKLSADPLHAKGIDQDIMEEITWEAQRDPATDCMLQFDRFSSLVAV